MFTAKAVHLATLIPFQFHHSLCVQTCIHSSHTAHKNCLCNSFLTQLYAITLYSPFNERIPKRQERYHIHLHISASQIFKKSSF